MYVCCCEKQDKTSVSKRRTVCCLNSVVLDWSSHSRLEFTQQSQWEVKVLRWLLGCCCFLLSHVYWGLILWAALQEMDEIPCGFTPFVLHTSLL